MGRVFYIFCVFIGWFVFATYVQQRELSTLWEYTFKEENKVNQKEGNTQKSKGIDISEFQYEGDHRIDISSWHPKMVDDLVTQHKEGKLRIDEYFISKRFAEQTGLPETASHFTPPPWHPTDDDTFLGLAHDPPPTWDTLILLAALFIIPPWAFLLVARLAKAAKLPALFVLKHHTVKEVQIGPITFGAIQRKIVAFTGFIILAIQLYVFWRNGVGGSTWPIALSASAMSFLVASIGVVKKP